MSEYEYGHDHEQDFDPNEEAHYELHRILRKVARGAAVTLMELQMLCYATGINIRDVT